MRPLALLLRAGAVVIALGFLFTTLVHRSSSSDGAHATTAAEPTVASKPTPKPAAVKKKATPKSKSKVPPGVVTIAAVGDIMMGSTGHLPPGGGRSLFRGVETDLAGDVVLGNLESTLSVGGQSKCKVGNPHCFAFQTPPSYAQWLRKAGFTVLNQANNHALDYGPAGQAQTLAALRAQRLAHTGRPGEIAYQQVGGIKVAVVGFAPYPWAQELTDIPAARALVKRAAKNADVVIVTMHAGAEGAAHAHVRPGTETYLGENRGNVVAFSHAVVEAGADVVIGHGPHVLRGMEWYHGHLIAYSLGNFTGYKLFALGGPSGVSGILRVTLRGDGRFESGTLVPIRLVGAGVAAVDPTHAANATVRTLSQEDFGARGVKVSRNGGLT
jgi:poly-gamma-glutamate capsule biosynthesis protein CapA/YwtB (metallophosphatase superfamily)